MAKIMTRQPIIALDYKEKHKAMPKELLIDYETGAIYIVSAHDKSVIFDITDRIYEQIQNMSGNNISISIDGIGEVKLTDILEQLQQGLEDTVDVIEIGSDINYVSKENILDEKSLEVINKYIELRGFSKAQKFTIPRKGADGKLEWIEPPMLTDQSGSCTSDSNIICPGNPKDGKITEVNLITPVNDKLYIMPTKRQKSVNIDKNCRVILPRTLDEYSEVEWYVVTNSFAPLFKFCPNVIWSNIMETQPKENSHQVYKFKTWDSGETWLAELVYYCKRDNIVHSNIVNIDYLETNYLDKSHIENTYYNKEEINSSYLNINELEDKYYDKKTIDDKHYNKQETDELLSWEDDN